MGDNMRQKEIRRLISLCLSEMYAVSEPPITDKFNRNTVDPKNHRIDEKLFDEIRTKYKKKLNPQGRYELDHELIFFAPMFKKEK